MSFNSLLIHTVGILNRTTGSTDRYGNETITFSAPVTSEARVEQNLSQETLGDRDTRLTWCRVFLPPTVTVAALDRVTWGTRTFEVDGEPMFFYDSGALHHFTVLAKEIKD